ncbi:MAG: LPS assembly lipoprotein LptE [Pseudomonadota bacterium]|nr:LPS assembly lipoprotein LptE [Pseudomonadota bacterium]
MAFAIEGYRDPTSIVSSVPAARVEVIKHLCRCYKVVMKTLFCMVGFLLLVGCGFQLRTWDLASAYQSVRIESHVDSSIDRDIRGVFVSSGLVVVDDGEADLHLTIDREDFEQSSDVFTGDGRVAGYRLQLRVTYQVSEANGKTLVSTRTLQEERSLPLNRANVVGSDAEKRLLVEEMRTDIVQRILRTLALLTDQVDKRSDAS